MIERERAFANNVSGGNISESAPCFVLLLSVSSVPQTFELNIILNTPSFLSESHVESIKQIISLKRCNLGFIY